MANEQLGFIGLGNMGIEMSKHLQKYLVSKQEPNVIYYNRTISKGDELKELGGVPGESVADVVSKSSIVFVMMTNDEVTKQVFDEAIGSGSLKGKLLINSATISPKLAEEIGNAVNAAGGTFLAGPVFGLPVVAAKAQLVFVVSGPKDQLDRVAPYMGSMSKAQNYMGEDYKRAQVMKLTGNTFIIGLMEVVGEAMVLGEANGIKSEDLADWAEAVGGPFLGLYFRKNSAGIYDPGENGSPLISTENILKDALLAQELGKSANAHLPTVSTAVDHFNQLLQRPEKNLDGSAIYGLLRLRAGLPFENDAVQNRK